MPGWRTYRVTVDFDVPLAFAFRWCTDYTPHDGMFSGEDRTIHLQRRIIERTNRRVVFENLYDEGRGWGWERHIVTLHPPNRWHCEGKGNHQESILDYTLTALPGSRTRCDMRWRSRPVAHSRAARPSAVDVESYVTGLWKKRARSLKREYQQSGR